MVANTAKVTDVTDTTENGGDPASPNLHVDVAVNRLKIPTVVLATVGVLSVLFLSFVLYRSLTLLLLLFLALLVATAIEPVVNWLRRGPFNRSAGILIVYTGLFLVIGLVGYIMFSVFFEQVGEFGGSLRTTVNGMRADVKTMGTGFAAQQAGLFVDAADAMVGKIERPATPASPDEKVQTVTTTTLTVAEIFFGVITVFVVAYYWLTERTLIKRAAMSWFPSRRANRIRRVWDDIEVKVGGWVRGQLTIMAIVGILSAIGYFFIGVQYWPALALFIAIAEAIPLVGPYIGTAPAILVALTQPGGGPGMALLVAAFAVVLQTIEGNVLIPRIMRNSVGITPLTVIISILLGATLAGIVGALVAVPLAGALQVIITDIKAARESEEKFDTITEPARATRQESGELVVAYPSGDNETKTQVKAEVG